MSDGLIDGLPSPLVKALDQTLGKAEQVHISLKGAYKEALVCTDTRVLIVKSGFMTGQMFGSDVFQLPYSRVAGVEVKYRILSGYFELSAGGMQNLPKNYWSQKQGVDPKQAANCVSLNDRTQASRFREACNFIMQRISQQDTGLKATPPALSRSDTPESILSTIKTLGDLRDQGHLSNDEFEAKKKALLARL